MRTLTYMAVTRDLLAAVVTAQSRNSTLDGEELRECGRQTARLARERRLGLLAADATGERLIGAALAMADGLRVFDRTQNLGGAAVLLVSGRVAGAAGLAQEVRMTKALGASRVEVAVLGGWADPIPGCASVACVSALPPQNMNQTHAPQTASRRVGTAA